MDKAKAARFTTRKVEWEDWRRQNGDPRPDFYREVDFDFYSDDYYAENYHPSSLEKKDIFIFVVEPIHYL